MSEKRRLKIWFDDSEVQQLLDTLWHLTPTSRKFADFAVVEKIVMLFISALNNRPKRSAVKYEWNWPVSTSRLACDTCQGVYFSLVETRLSTCHATALKKHLANLVSLLTKTIPICYTVKWGVQIKNKPFVSTLEDEDGEELERRFDEGVDFCLLDFLGESCIVDFDKMSLTTEARPQKRSGFSSGILSRSIVIASLAAQSRMKSKAAEPVKQPTQLHKGSIITGSPPLGQFPRWQICEGSKWKVLPISESFLLEAKYEVSLKERTTFTVTFGSTDYIVDIVGDETMGSTIMCKEDGLMSMISREFCHVPRNVPLYIDGDDNISVNEVFLYRNRSTMFVLDILRHLRFTVLFVTTLLQFYESNYVNLSLIKMEKLQTEEFLEKLLTVYSIPIDSIHILNYHPQVRFEILVNGIWSLLPTVDVYLLEQGHHSLFLCGKWCPFSAPGMAVFCEGEWRWVRRQGKIAEYCRLMIRGAPLSIKTILLKKGVFPLKFLEESVVLYVEHLEHKKVVDAFLLLDALSGDGEEGNSWMNATFAEKETAALHCSQIFNLFGVNIAAVLTQAKESKLAKVGSSINFGALDLGPEDAQCEVSSDESTSTRQSSSIVEGEELEVIHKETAGVGSSEEISQPQNEVQSHQSIQTEKVAPPRNVEEKSVNLNSQLALLMDQSIKKYGQYRPAPRPKRVWQTACSPSLHQAIFDITSGKQRLGSEHVEKSNTLPSGYHIKTCPQSYKFRFPVAVSKK